MTYNSTVHSKKKESRKKKPYDRHYVFGTANVSNGTTVYDLCI